MSRTRDSKGPRTRRSQTVVTIGNICRCSVNPGTPGSVAAHGCSAGFALPEPMGGPLGQH